VGSHAKKRKKNLKLNGKITSENNISITDAILKNGRLQFNYHIVGSIEQKELRSVIVVKDRITKFKNRENKNQTLKNSNIVVAVLP